MTKVILIRHGQTEWNKIGKFQGQSDVALSENGINQAKILAEKFPWKIDKAYTSDLVRAYETGSTVAKKFGMTVAKEPAFREMNFGEWEGLELKEIEKRWPEEFKNFFVKPSELRLNGGETFKIVQERAMKRLNELVKENEGKTILIAAHGAVNRMMLTAIMHMPLDYAWTLCQDNTAVNILRYDDGNWMVELINSTAHLQA